MDKLVGFARKKRLGDLLVDAGVGILKIHIGDFFMH